MEPTDPPINKFGNEVETCNEEFPDLDTILRDTPELDELRELNFNLTEMYL